MIGNLHFIWDNIHKLYIIPYIMKDNILDKFKRVPYFSTNGYRQLAGYAADNAYRARIDLMRAVDAGEIIRLKKGVYMADDFFRSHRRDPDFTAAISAIIYPNSYLSLHSILQRAGVLTDLTRVATSVTTRSNRVIENTIGTFSYQHLKPSLYHGYKIKTYFGVSFAEASLSKALFDFLYLEPNAAAIRSARYDFVEELRLNLGDFPHSQQQEFHDYCQGSGVAKMQSISKFLRENTWKI
jgi:hypothetical protein